MSEKPDYPPSGLKQITWTITGENNFNASDTINVSSLSESSEEDFVYKTLIPIRMRDSTFGTNGAPSGIYSILIEVEDKNGNKTVVGPNTFSYNVSSFRPIDIIVEKLIGDLAAPDYFAGETLRFTLDSDESFDTITWNSYPTVILTNNAVLKSAIYEDISYGQYEISTFAEKNGIPYVGNLLLTVNATQGYIHAPIIEFTSPQDLTHPFDVTVKTLREYPLSSDPKDTLKAKNPIAFIGGSYTGIIVDIDPKETSSVYEQSFTCWASTPEGSLLTLSPGEWASFIFVAEDAAGHQKEVPFNFIP